MARVKLIVDKEDLAPEHAALFNELAALRGRISGPSTIVLHSPGLARPWNQVSEYLHRDSIVEPEHAEMAVCATARERDCGYVWNAHVPLALKAGIARQTIAAVAERRPADALPEPARTVVLYARQLLQNNRVEDDVFDRLLRAHDPRWLVELTVWIGRYAALSGILNAFELTHASPAEVLPSVPVPTRQPASVRAPLASPRITPITRRDQVSEEHRVVFDAVTGERGGVRGPFPWLLYSPVLCGRHLDVGTFLRSSSEVGANARELAIIATAREKDCPYVWAAHAPAARKAGVGDAAVTAVRERGDLAGLPAAERDVVDYVRQLLGNSQITQPLFDRMRAEYGVTWLVELTCLIGHLTSCSTIAVTPYPSPCSRRTSASASASSATLTATSASRVKRGSVRTATARPPTSACSDPSCFRSAQMRPRALWTRLSGGGVATGRADLPRLRTEPRAVRGAKRREALRSPRRTPLDARAAAAAT